MRRTLFLLALFALAAPASQASSHAHARIPLATPGLQPHHFTISYHPPTLHPETESLPPTPAPRESSFPAFVIRTLMGFTTHASH